MWKRIDPGVIYRQLQTKAIFLKWNNLCFATFTKPQLQRNKRMFQLMCVKRLSEKLYS